jgi:hypothetical protein
VIDATPLQSDTEAEAWLAAALGGETTIARALGVLTRAVAARRVAAADPWLPDPDPDRALATRVGYGEGEAVAHGDWEVARELEAGRRGRPRRALDPQERVAALLSGRDAALACEELALRTRADLTGGRAREAALGLRPALEAALAELEPWAERGDLRTRLEELARLRSEAVGTYERALEGGLDEQETARVDRVLGRVEAALRARTAGGIE